MITSDKLMKLTLLQIHPPHNQGQYPRQSQITLMILVPFGGMH